MFDPRGNHLVREDLGAVGGLAVAARATRHDVAADLQDDPATRLRTRIRALLTETVGATPSTS